MANTILMAGGEIPTVLEIGRDDLNGLLEGVFAPAAAEIPLNQAWPGIILLATYGEAEGEAFSKRLLQASDTDEPAVLDNLLDLKNLLFAWDSLGYALDQVRSIENIGTLLEDFSRSLKIGFDQIVNDFFNPAASKRRMLDHFMENFNVEVKEQLGYLADLGSPAVLDMIQRAYSGSGQSDTTADNFAARAFSFFAQFDGVGENPNEVDIGLTRINSSLTATGIRNRALADTADGKAHRNALLSLSTYLVSADALTKNSHEVAEYLDVGQYSDQFFEDRARMLVEYSSFLTKGTAYAQETLAYFNDGLTGIELQTSVEFANIFGLPPVPADSLTNIVFGDNASNLDLAGNGFADRIYGLDGFDVIHGNNGNDYIEGNQGSDQLFGDGNDDTLHGNQDHDSLFGGDGADTLYGGTGNDTLIGVLDDLFTDDNRADRLEGGEGHDKYRIGNGDVIADSDGTGEVRWFTSTQAMTGGKLKPELGPNFYQSDDGNYRFVLLGTDLLIIALNDSGIATGTATIENFDKTADTLGIHLDDTVDTPPPPPTPVIDGTAIADTLFGTVDDDQISGFDGDDELFGDTGNDLLFGGDGNDNLFGEDGDDRLFGEAGDDFMIATPGDDYLDGGAGRDALIAGEDNDILIGGEGDDFLSGGEGNDTLIGGLENGQSTVTIDHNLLAGGAGADVIQGSSGDDTIYGDATYQATPDRTWAVERTTDADGNTIVSITGGAFGTAVSANDGADLVFGGAGDDIIFGGGGGDVLYGEAGADMIEGQSGNDTLDGGEGNDILHGDDRDDQLFDPAGKGDHHVNVTNNSKCDRMAA